MRKIAAVTIVMLLAGCGAGQWANLVDLNSVPDEERNAALGVRLFDQTMQTPPATEIIGNVQAVSCQNKVWDAPATRGNALEQLRIRAYRMGADAITGITYTELDTTYRPNCWHSIVVSGTAVKL